MKTIARLSAVSSLLLAACISASATPLAGGGTVLATPVNTVPTQYLSVVNMTPFTSQAGAGMASTFNGLYTTAVFKDSANTLCSSVGNCLSFAIQVLNSSTSTDGIETVTTGPFDSTFTYNVGYVPIAGGIAPLVIKDTPSGTFSFNFTANSVWASIMPGFSSDYLIIQSSATAYQTGNVSFQDNQTATVTGFIPSLAVTPEPSSLMLLGTGLIGTATTLLRRRKISA